MSHEIEIPVDEVRSTSGNSEWHGLATPPVTQDNGKIGLHTVTRLCPRVHEIPVAGIIDGEQIILPNYKALVADYRECRPETVGTDRAFIPLHIPKAGYKVISHLEIYNAAQEALKGIDAEIVTCGTLGAGKKFFLSIDVRGHSEMMVCGRDKTRAFINLISSNDGTLACMGYDSLVRIVCMNTLKSSLNAAGNVKFKVYHTKGAEVAMVRMGELINEILKGRETFLADMSILDGITLDSQQASNIALAYFVKTQNQDAEEKSFELSTRARNAAEEITSLFSRGKGNRGRTAYDLLQGVTDYYTNGSGVGKSGNQFQRLSRANHGAASDHKANFRKMLCETQDYSELIDMGRRASLESAK